MIMEVSMRLNVEKKISKKHRKDFTIFHATCNYITEKFALHSSLSLEQRTYTHSFTYSTQNLPQKVFKSKSKNNDVPLAV